MTINYVTVVNSMIVARSVGAYQDVVTAVNWSVVGSDGTYNSQINGTTAVGPVDPNDFTPYPDLTEQHVLSWIADPSTPEVQAQIAESVNNQAGAQVLMDVPWS